MTENDLKEVEKLLDTAHDNPMQYERNLHLIVSHTRSMIACIRNQREAIKNAYAEAERGC